MIVEPDRDALRAALDRETRRLVDRVRAGTDLDAPAPGLDWTAGQLVAHLCVVYRAFALAVRGDDYGEFITANLGTGHTLPEVVASTNARALAVVSFPGPREAADGLRDCADELLAALDTGPDLRAARPTPWYGTDVTRTVGTLVALSVSESVVHGYDLAGALRTRPWLDERSAATAAPIVMSEMLPLLVDPSGSRGFTGSYEVRIRHAPRFVLQLDAGRASTVPADGREVDCVLSLSGCDALLVGFHRRKLWHAIASGGALAYGRRPWLGLRFHSLFRLP
ncbi:maleylpyruvate isomerase N-terminal domain-containing protein [Paractinoplanes globisporus]|uniref:Maleylpyruvate isomerase N-terminal domain-containing protein n=1 Tax=Paractinoplanes globisporus TaxID=113565 RepID=A0ABW6W9W5_9ACTN|nr:maleylpyruvate isomerase N-terminal domain-containing protein [Actinoplanes globisporus]